MLPETLILNTIRWYHLLFGYYGSTRLYNTIRAKFIGTGLCMRYKNYRCPYNSGQYNQQKWLMINYLCNKQILLPRMRLVLILLDPGRLLLVTMSMNLMLLLVLILLLNLLNLFVVRKRKVHTSATNPKIFGCLVTQDQINAL